MSQGLKSPISRNLKSPKEILNQIFKEGSNSSGLNIFNEHLVMNESDLIKNSFQSPKRFESTSENFKKKTLICNQCKLNECKCNYNNNYNNESDTNNELNSKPLANNLSNTKPVNNIDLKKILLDLKNSELIQSSASSSSLSSSSTLISHQNSVLISPSTSSMFANPASSSQIAPIISLVNT